MDIIPHIKQAGAGGALTRIGPNPGVIKVDPVLGKALKLAGIQACGTPDDKLSQEQLTTFLDGQDVRTRIQLKILAQCSGIYPT
jgi:hypothetical protein